VVEHCLRAEIAEARGTLICIKEHRRVDIRNVLGYEWIYRAYAVEKQKNTKPYHTRGGNSNDIAYGSIICVFTVHRF